MEEVGGKVFYFSHENMFFDRIFINIHADNITIIHRKKQKHLDPMKKDEQFEFEWVLKITLPPTLDSIKSIDLSICSLVFGEHTSKAKKMEMIQMFRDYLDKIPSID